LETEVPHENGIATEEAKVPGELLPPSRLQRILSTRSEIISSQDPGPPPDGGRKAWLQGISFFYSGY
jgi:hypothetical protein